MGNATLTFGKTAAFADGMATLFPWDFSLLRADSSLTAVPR